MGLEASEKFLTVIGLAAGQLGELLSQLSQEGGSKAIIFTTPLEEPRTQDGDCVSIALNS